MQACQDCAAATSGSSLDTIQQVLFAEPKGSLLETLSRHPLLIDSVRMLFRLFWPSTADQCGILVGWWLTEEGQVSQSDDCSQALVACVVPTLAGAEARLKAHDPMTSHPARILGEILPFAEKDQAELHRRRPPGLWMLCCSDCSGQTGRPLPIRLESSKKTPLTLSSVQVVLYQVPAQRGPLAKVILGAWPQWIDALPTGALRPALLESILPLLDVAPLMSESLQVEQRLHARAACLFCCAASACAVSGRLSRVMLGLYRWLVCYSFLERSAAISQLHIRLQLQSLLMICFQSCARAPSRAERLALVALISSALMDAFLGAAIILISWLLWSYRSNFCTLDSLDLLLLLARLHRWAYEEKLVDLVTWLMGAPADFKLNRELTSFVGDLFLSLFSLWSRLVLHALQMLHTPAVAHVLRICCVIAGLSGLSTLLACAMDLLAIASLPLFVAYLGTCLCWKTATQSLYTLSLLFQGRKHNVLRFRIDHHHFDLNQLLIGVILLSMVVFLLPSLFMFYSCFMGSWLLVLAAHYALGLFVSLCNHFPSCLLSLIPDTHVMLELKEDPKEDPKTAFRTLLLTIRPGSTRLSSTMRAAAASLGPLNFFGAGLMGLSGEALTLCHLHSPSLTLAYPEPDSVVSLAEVLRFIWSFAEKSFIFVLRGKRCCVLVV